MIPSQNRRPPRNLSAHPMDMPPATKSATPRKPRRRWLRFSLRTLFLVTTALCVWIAIRVNSARRVRSALAAVNRAGGTAWFDYQVVPGKSGKPNDFTVDSNAAPPGAAWLRERLGDEYFINIVGVKFDGEHSNRPIPATDLAEIAKLPTLNVFTATDTKNTDRRYPGRPPKVEAPPAQPGVLSRLITAVVGDSHPRTQIDDDGLAALGTATALEELTLDYSPITDESLKHLAGLTNLRLLSLDGANLTGAGLKYIPFNRLETLNLVNTNLDDDGATSLERFANLEILNLSNTKITDAALQHLRTLARLKTLDLSYTGVTGTGLEFIASKSLTDLNLNASRLSDTGLEQIGKLTSLKSLTIYASLITDDGLAHLQNLVELERLNVFSTNISLSGAKYFKSLKRLKQIRLLGPAIEYKFAYALQEAFPSTGIDVYPVLRAVPQPERDDRRPFPRIRLPQDVVAPAMPARDDSGARWKIRLPPTNRKQSLLGRPSTFTQDQWPLDHYLVRRDLVSGIFFEGFETIELPAAPAQVVDNRRGCVCVLLSNVQTESPGDILCFNRFPPRSSSGLVIRGHSEPPWRVIFSPGPFSDRLVSCSDDGSIRLWAVREHETESMPWPRTPFARAVTILPGTELAKLPCYGHDENGGVTRGEFAAFSPYGQHLATAFKDKVSFHSPKDGTEQFAWDAQLPDGQRIMAVRFDANGNSLFAFVESAGDTHEATMKFLQYDLDKLQAQQYVGTHGVVDGRATADNRLVITWDGSPNVVFWDQSQHREFAVIQVAPEHVYDVAFSPAGDVMATAGDDGQAKFWKVADQSRLETPQPFLHEGIDLIQFSADGKTLFTGSDDGWLKAWTAPDFTWDRRPQPTQSEYHPDGTLIETFPDGSVKTSKKR